jgi:hypothetical protein
VQTLDIFGFQRSVTVTGMQKEFLTLVLSSRWRVLEEDLQRGELQLIEDVLHLEELQRDELQLLEDELQSTAAVSAMEKSFHGFSPEKIWRIFSLIF